MINKLMNQAMKREDKRYIPVMLATLELNKLGYDLEYIIDSMDKYYDGREIKYETGEMEIR